MAKIKLGSLITSASGAIGGHVVGVNNGNVILKNKSVPRKVNTLKQSINKKLILELNSLFSSLSEEQLSRWELEALVYSSSYMFGELFHISAINLFRLCNANLYKSNLSFLLEPSNYHVASVAVQSVIFATSSVILYQSNSYIDTDIIHVYASNSLSNGISKPRKNMRFLTSVTGIQVQNEVDLFDAYVSVFGQPLQESRLYFGFKTISSISGFSNKKLVINDTATSVLGNTNLVVNGDFSDGTNNWVPYNSNSSISASNNIGRVTALGNDRSGMRQLISGFEIGENYEVSFNYDLSFSPSNSLCRLSRFEGLPSNGISIANLNSGTSGLHVSQFIANRETLWFGWFTFQNIENGDFCEYSNITITKI